jgi:predicted ArsR family transcriptional regulator
MLTDEFFETSRGRIVAMLREGAFTIDELAAKLGLTANAVRAQVAPMERDGLVQRVGARGTTRPASVYALTPDAQKLLSRAYIPFLTQLVHVFSAALPESEVERLMRTAGRALADELWSGADSSKDLRERVDAASELLNRELGALTRVEETDSYRIRGAGCPLAAITGKHPAVCLAIEGLVTDVVGAPAHECCDRDGPPRCCFQIQLEKSAV